MTKRKRKIIIILSISLIFILCILPFSVSAFIYESNFGDRYESYEPMARNIDEFEGLQSNKYTFASNKGQQLVGYKYYYEDMDAKGVVVIAHGLGGGHNSYLDVADYFASNGYMVFAYDATGNDESEGDSVNGLPQGIIDLDYAISYVKQTEDFNSLPIMLFGHSWGAYSVGNVLNLHPDIKAVVMAAGFNTTMDLIEEQGEKMIGGAIKVFMPYLSVYERIKFGKYAAYSCIDGFNSSEAEVMIIHSTDDDMIPPEISYDNFYASFKDNPRFTFIQYENRGHNYIYYSDAARQYLDRFNSEFEEYVHSLGVELTADIKADYLNEKLNKQLLFDLDDELMNRIIDCYDNSIKK